MYYNKEHEEKVNNRGDGYTYIGSYKCKEITIDGKNKKRNNGYIRVRCPYCGSEYDVLLGKFKKGDKCINCCHNYENSFAYHIQVELKEPLNKYWNWDKNIVNPYLIYKSSGKKIWIKCDKKDYHNDDGGYLISPAYFNNGRRCPYCCNHHGKVHIKDSFGTLYPEKAKYWSPNNKKSPYEVTPYSNYKYKFICEKCGKEFKRSLNSLNKNDNGVVCLECNCSQLEYKTKEVLIKYNINYKVQVEYDDLTGLKGGQLSYDFYLPQYNILIECQGEQHKHFIKGLQKTKEEFERQLEHDRRKKEYAKKHDLKLLEIWYYDYENIENILLEELKIINKR